jgi:hypothetical protein
MKKVSLWVWLLAAMTVTVVVITGYNHHRGKVDIQFFEWLMAKAAKANIGHLSGVCPQTGNRSATATIEHATSDDSAPSAQTKTRGQNLPAGDGQTQADTKVELQGGPGHIGAIGFSRDGESLVMIDQKIFHEGDVVNGYKILRIDPEKVQFERDGQIWIQGVR